MAPTFIFISLLPSSCLLQVSSVIFFLTFMPDCILQSPLASWLVNAFWPSNHRNEKLDFSPLLGRQPSPFIWVDLTFMSKTSPGGQVQPACLWQFFFIVRKFTQKLFKCKSNHLKVNSWHSVPSDVCSYYLDLPRRHLQSSLHTSSCQIFFFFFLSPSVSFSRKLTFRAMLSVWGHVLHYSGSASAGFTLHSMAAPKAHPPPQNTQMQGLQCLMLVGQES